MWQYCKVGTEFMANHDYIKQEVTVWWKDDVEWKW
jgi:hypothetical protein